LKIARLVKEFSLQPVPWSSEKLQVGGATFANRSAREYSRTLPQFKILEED